MDTESAKDIIVGKIDLIHERILAVKSELSVFREEYVNEYRQTLLNNPAFATSLKLLAECVDAGNILNEGSFNRESYLTRLFKDLPAPSPKSNSKLKAALRSDVTLGQGMY